MGRRIASIVAAVSVLLLIALNARPPAQGPDAFAERANAICRDVRIRAARLPPYRTPEEQIAFVERSIELNRDAEASFATLVELAPDREAFDELLEAIRDANDGEEALLSAARAGNARAVDVATDSIKASQKTFQTVANFLGLTDCRTPTAYSVASSRRRA